MMSNNEYYFLKNFLKPKSRSNVLNMRDWNSYLGQNAELAFKGFQNDGTLKLANTEKAATATYSATELREIASSLDLATSGTKPDLVARILKFSPTQFDGKLYKHDFWVCSDEGAKKVSDKGKLIESETTAAIENSVNEAICRNFESAFAPVRKYQQSLPFPSGLGVEWSNFGSSKEVFILETILDDWPGILSEIKPELKPSARQGAIRMFLWGLKLDAKLKKRLANNGTHLDPDSICRMIVFFAQNKFRISDATLKSQELELPYIMKVMRFEGDFCLACEKFKIGVYSLNEVPEIPLADCRGLSGCSLSISEAIDT